VSGYVLSADADLDLDEIWDYIAADNIDARRSLDWQAVRCLSKPSGKRRAWAIGVVNPAAP
jgi:plasmid stabilization system protein ParE